MGYAYLLIGDLESADQSLRAAVSMDSRNERAINNLAMVSGRRGKYNEALQLFQISGEDAEAYANLAYVMTENGHLGKAADAYHRALDLDADLTVAAEALVQLEPRLRPNAAERPFVVTDEPTEMIAEAKRSPARRAAVASTACLLYTSPSPRDATLSRMPSSA